MAVLGIERGRSRPSSGIGKAVMRVEKARRRNVGRMLK